MALSLEELEEALRSSADAFIVSLDLPTAKAQAIRWRNQAMDAVGRATTAADPVARAAARKEVQDFETAFNLKFATMELRADEAARQTLFDLGKKATGLILKSIVALLV